MAYDLYRAAHPRELPAAANLLGNYPDFPTALAARDRDVLRQLEQTGGRRVELTHLIVGAGARGPATAHALACSVGQPTNGPVDISTELEETAQWLERLRTAE